MRTFTRLNQRRLATQLLTVTFLTFIAIPAEALTWEEEVTADSPLSWWRLDEPAGSTVFVDSGSVGLDLNAKVFDLAADFDDNKQVDGADFLIWQEGAGTLAGAMKSQGDANDDEAVNGLDLAVWEDEYGKAAKLTAGLPSLPAIGSAIDSTSGYLEAFDDVKGGILAITTRADSPDPNVYALENSFTYEAWVKVTTTDTHVGHIGGNSVNANPLGEPVLPDPNNPNGVYDQYGTRMIVNTDNMRFGGGLTGVRLINESGVILQEIPTAQGQPTKDLHFPGDDFGVDPNQRLFVEAEQWYYVVAQWGSEGFDGSGIPLASFAGHVYWQDPNGDLQERHRDHGTNFDFGRIRLPDPNTGLLGFALGAQGMGMGNASFQGQISEFAVYGEVLTEERLEAHFLAGIAGAPLTAVPEPSVTALLFAGGLVVGLGRRKVRRLLKRRPATKGSSGKRVVAPG